jgi:hypothetical protein
MNWGKSLQFFSCLKSELDDLLSDETWYNKVAFLADISQALNTLSKSMQEKYENTVTFILVTQQ